jgi:hypothetical protein
LLDCAALACGIGTPFLSYAVRALRDLNHCGTSTRGGHDVRSKIAVRQFAGAAWIACSENLEGHSS